jgi:spore maturation protein CgeB
MNLNIVIFGLSITSSWGNGHAVTYRALTKALHERGHRIVFLERDTPWYREHRDLEDAQYCRICLYKALREIPTRFGELVSRADLVIVGSYVPDGTLIADWVTTRAQGITAFYDIDTPVTIAGLEAGKTEYISASLIPRFDLYLSFTGGPVLSLIENLYGSPRARALYCAADPDLRAEPISPPCWALGYLGTYSKDRQFPLERLLMDPARQLAEEKFIVAGAQYPADLQWPANVEHIEHVPPEEHATFYRRQRYTLNLTRAEMRALGFSPSVRLFESASCGVPIISDRWTGLDEFFAPGGEILVADSSREIVQIINEIPEERRRDIAAAARKRLLRDHLPRHRARALEEYYTEALRSERAGRTGAQAIA